MTSSRDQAVAAQGVAFALRLGACALVFGALVLHAHSSARAFTPNQDPAPSTPPIAKPVDAPPTPQGDKPATKPDATPPKPESSPPVEAPQPQTPPVTPDPKTAGKQGENHGEKPGEKPGETPVDPATVQHGDANARVAPNSKGGDAQPAQTTDATRVEAAPNAGAPTKEAALTPPPKDAKVASDATLPTNSAPNSATTPPARVFDYSVRATQASFEAEVRRLVTTHANRLRVTSIGKSRNARDLWLLTASDLAAGDPDKKPALFVATGLDPSFEGRPAGPEAALFALRALLESADRDASVAAWLARTTVYVVPAPDPDQAFAPESVGARACRLDRNFPSDWKPWSSESCAQGPYPLSEPETQNLARFLAARANVGAALLFSRGAQLVTDTTLDATDELERILCARIVAEEAAARSEDAATHEPTATDGERATLENSAKRDETAKRDDSAHHGTHATVENTPSESPKAPGDALARRSEAFARESGSLAAFCRARMSAFVVAFDPNVGAIVEGSRGRVPAGFARAAAAIERLARELPRLECTVVKSERLRERLWMVDIDIENQGLLPTLGESERARCPGSVWFEVTGGRVAQVGIARHGNVETNAALKQPGVWLVGHLDGREKARLHVLVDAAEATTLELVFRTLRDGETKCAVTLH